MWGYIPSSWAVGSYFDVIMSSANASCPTWREETEAWEELEAEDRTHQGLFKTASSELRIMKALQLSVIKAEGLDKNSVLVSWDLSPFSKHYPSESSLDGFSACSAGQLLIASMMSLPGGQPHRGKRETSLPWGRGKGEIGVWEIMKLFQ